MAAAAASWPLFPAPPPARSMACASVSTVSSPKPAGGFAGHVLEMGRLAPDHRAERHQAGVAPRAGGGGSRHGKLERAGHPHDVHPVPGDAGGVTAGEGAFQEAGGHGLVVPADEDGHATDGSEAAGELGHGGRI
jgi:hypothetical protein